MNYRKVKTSQGTVSAVVANNSRETFVAGRPTRAPFVTNLFPARAVPAIVATNARQTRVV